MWQRIQSVFLGIAILALLGALFVPLWVGAEGTHLYWLYPLHFMHKIQGETGAAASYSYVPFSVTALLMVAAITVAVQEFRRFDNRLLQVKLGTLNALILAGVMLSSVYFSSQVMREHPGANGHYDLGLYLTFVAVAANWISMRFIRRDEKLVRDSDRIR